MGTEITRSPTWAAINSVSRCPFTDEALVGSQISATRRAPGRTSLNSSRVFPATSRSCVETPVTLPPGRPRLATKPAPTGSAHHEHHDRNRLGFLLEGLDRLRTDCREHVLLQSDEILRKLSIPLVRAPSKPKLKTDVLRFSPAKRLQPLTKARE